MPGNEVNPRRSSMPNLRSSHVNSDTHNPVNTPASIPAAEPMTADQFNDAMNTWVNEAPAGEHAARVSVADTMKAAFTDSDITHLFFHGDNASDSSDISSLPSALGELQNITTLGVMWQRNFTGLPVLTRPMERLEQLIFTQCTSLTTLPAQFASQTPNLQNLNFSACRALTVQPEHIEPLLNRNLEMLWMEGCPQENINTLRIALPRLNDFINATGQRTQSSIDAYNQRRRYLSPDDDGSNHTTPALSRQSSVNEPDDDPGLSNHLIDEMPSLTAVIERAYEKAKLVLDPVIKEQWKTLVNESQTDAARATQLNNFGHYINKVLTEWVPHAIPGEHVTDVLAIAVQDENLLDELCETAQKGIDNCADNRMITFNDMQVQAKCAAIMADNTITDKRYALLTLLKGQFRKQMLAGFSEQIMLERWKTLGLKMSAEGIPLDHQGKKTSPHLNEALELELALRYKLGESLALPFPIKSMQYLGIAENFMIQSNHGNNSITSEQKIETITSTQDKARAFVLTEEKDTLNVAASLMMYRTWKTYLTKHYAINLAQLTDEFSTQKNALTDPYTQENDLSSEALEAAMNAYAHDVKTIEHKEELTKYEYLLKTTSTLLSEMKA